LRLTDCAGLGAFAALPAGLAYLGAEAEVAFVDSTHCKVHQHANGATDRATEAVGTSRGELNTKIHAACDALLRLCTPMVLTPGNISDYTAAPEVSGPLRDCVVVEDKGYDSKENRERLRAQGCEPCVPSRKGTKEPESYDEHLYRSRHCIENLFQKLKVFRRVATRYEKTKRMILSGKCGREMAKFSLGNGGGCARNPGVI
jgi:transposase